MTAPTEGSDQELIRGIDAFHQRACSVQRELFGLIAAADRQKVWRHSGARDMAHFIRMRCGISEWKAHRWIAAAHALEDLPRISRAFSSGELGIDKVVELTRFATPHTEGDLLKWARDVSSGAIRHKADLAHRQPTQDLREAERSRWWYFDEGRRFGPQVELPAADGVVVAKALERLAEKIPVIPGEEDACFAEARRADALVALCSARIAEDPNPDRATVVVHAQLDGMASGRGGCELERWSGNPPRDREATSVEARVQTVIEDTAGQPVGLGRMSREPSAWMMRQLRYRDLECRFPGCGARRFTQAHHIRWWENGGPTDLDNVLLVCTFHHKLVHEYGWAVRRETDGTARWSRPDGTPYRAGRAPPPNRVERKETVVSAAGV